MNIVGSPRGFDFHCHVDLDRDPPAFIARCEKERIVTLAVTTTPKAWPQNREWAKRSQYVLPALGLHPELVAARHQEFELFKAILHETRFIGEVGLDGSGEHRKGLSLQQEIFGAILDQAETLGGRVVTIHSRWAANEVLELIAERTTNDRVLCILHWFSGNPSLARRAISLGCYFSVNGAMLANERGRALIESLPVDRLLTETDSPFTATGTRPSAPWDVVQTTERLAKIRGVSSREMNDVLRRNSRAVLAFAGLQIEP
jgi:TatD DNase family protein